MPRLAARIVHSNVIHEPTVVSIPVHQTQAHSGVVSPKSNSVMLSKRRIAVGERGGTLNVRTASSRISSTRLVVRVSRLCDGRALR